MAFFMPAVEAYVALDAPHHVDLVFYNLPAEGVQTQLRQRVTVTMSAIGAEMLCMALRSGMKTVRSRAGGKRRPK